MLVRIAEGDEKAFYRLYVEFAPRLRSYIRKFTHSAEDTEEMIQESFMRIWLHRDKLPEIHHLPSWIYRVTARNCLNFLRKQHNEEKKIAHLAKKSSGNEQEEHPLNILQHNEIKRIAQQAVLGLSDSRRTIYRMNREQGLTPAEIAAQLNMPVGTVKNNLTSANKIIREFMAMAGYQIPFFLAICFQLQ